MGGMDEEESLLPPDNKFKKNYGTRDEDDDNVSQVSFCLSATSSSVDSSQSEDSKGFLEAGWCIVVLACSFVCLCVLDGISYTFGVFLPSLMEDLEGGRGEVSAAGSF